MIPFRRWLTVVVLGWVAATALAACNSGPATPTEDRPPPLLLISIDGFRHDYFDLIDSPAMDRLMEGGLHADSLYQVFPTKTFPTHYSLVTGLYPGSHGIVANSMWDPDRNARFSMRDRRAVGDGYWYRSSEPIWVTAEKQGLVAATLFWPGSEARIQRVRPSHWKPYAGSLPHEARIEQILAWAALPPDERPAFMSLYFSIVDSLGHTLGPAAPGALAAASRIDDQLATLMAGLEALDLFDQMHILLVSDHGMTEVDIARYVMLDDYLDLDRVRVSDWGPAAQIWATEMTVDEIVAALDGAHPRLRVWAGEAIPARYRFGTHRRVPDVLLEADPGWMISDSAYIARRPPPTGMHGWDPAWGEMHGILVAHGPAFRAGSRSPAMRGIDLYALMTKLLALDPAEHEGTLDPFVPYFADNPPTDYRQLHFHCDRAGPVEARVGPAHMALHLGGYIHVLDRIKSDGPMRFEEVDLDFWIDDQHAGGTVDGSDLGDCRRH